MKPKSASSKIIQTPSHTHPSIYVIHPYIPVSHSFFILSIFCLLRVGTMIWQKKKEKKYLFGISTNPFVRECDIKGRAKNEKRRGHVYIGIITDITNLFIRSHFWTLNWIVLLRYLSFKKIEKLQIKFTSRKLSNS